MMAPKQEPFAIVPWKVAADGRLTSRELRVLIALLSFRARNTGLFFATREQIGERCGMRPGRVSTTTSSLADKGYIVKLGKGGRSMATRYEFTLPADVGETVPKVETVPKAETVPDWAQNGTHFGYLNGTPRGVHAETLTETHIAETQNTARAGRATASRERARGPAAPACPDDVDAQTWADWLAVRRAKRAGPVTATVLAGMRREAAKAAASLETAVRTCAERGWQGFRADWLRPAGAAGGGHEPDWRREQRARNVAFLGPAASPEARAAVAADRARTLGHVVEVAATELPNAPAASLG